MITVPLIRQITLQSDVLPSDEEVQNARTKTMEKIRKDQQQNVENVHLKQSPELQRKITQITEPGASSWLGALPLSEYGFNLGRGEFQDALCLRYNKNLKNLPSKCVCGAKFDTTHAQGGQGSTRPARMPVLPFWVGTPSPFLSLLP